MKTAALFCAVLGFTIAKPNGFYHQEYNYQTSSSSYKNHELQHKNDDEGFYSKDGDIEGRFRPRINAHSQHSEYVNPKMQHGGYIGRSISSGQLHAQNQFSPAEPGMGGYAGTYGYGGPNYGVNSNLRQVTMGIQTELERELQRAVFDHYRRATAYGNTITQAQIDTDRRVLEEELRRNVTMRLQEALKQQYGIQGIRGAHSYSMLNGRLQPTANYHNQELADLTRQMETHLMRQLEQQVQTYYHTRVNTEVHTQQTTFHPHPPMNNYPSPLQERPVYHPYPQPHVPIPDSITTVASRVQTELNEHLNRILEDIQRRYFSSESFHSQRPVNFEMILAQLQEELRANITLQLNDQIKRTYAFTNYASKYSQEDIENLRRQIETNLITKLNRDFNRQREKFFQTHPPNPHMYETVRPIPANHVYYPANNLQYQDVAVLQRELQESLSRQLQAALMQHQYRQAHMYSGGANFNAQANYQATLEQLSAELNRNLTRQMEEFYRTHNYQANGVYGAQLANMRTQLQHDLMRQLQQGLQQSYSRYSSWSSASSSSSNYRQVRGFDPNLYRSYGVSSEPIMGEDCMMGDDPSVYQQQNQDEQQVQNDQDLTQQVQTHDDLTQQVQTHDDLTQQTLDDETHDLTQQLQTHDDLTQETLGDQTHDLTQQLQTHDDLTQQTLDDETHDLTQQVQTHDDLTQQVQTLNDQHLTSPVQTHDDLTQQVQTHDDLTQQTQDLTQQVQTHDNLLQQTPDLTQQTQPHDDLTQQTQDLTQQVQTHDDLTQQSQDLTQQVQTHDDLTQQVRTLDDQQLQTHDNLQDITQQVQTQDNLNQVQDLTQQVQTGNNFDQLPQNQYVQRDYKPGHPDYNRWHYVPYSQYSQQRVPTDQYRRQYQNTYETSPQYTSTVTWKPQTITNDNNRGLVRQRVDYFENRHPPTNSGHYRLYKPTYTQHPQTWAPQYQNRRFSTQYPQIPPNQVSQTQLGQQIDNSDLIQQPEEVSFGRPQQPQTLVGQQADLTQTQDVEFAPLQLGRQTSDSTRPTQTSNFDELQQPHSDLTQKPENIGFGQRVIQPGEQVYRPIQQSQSDQFGQSYSVPEYLNQFQNQPQQSQNYLNQKPGSSFNQIDDQSQQMQTQLGQQSDNSFGEIQDQSQQEQTQRGQQVEDLTQQIQSNNFPTQQSQLKPQTENLNQQTQDVEFGKLQIGSQSKPPTPQQTQDNFGQIRDQSQQGQEIQDLTQQVQGSGFDTFQVGQQNQDLTQQIQDYQQLPLDSQSNKPQAEQIQDYGYRRLPSQQNQVGQVVDSDLTQQTEDEDFAKLTQQQAQILEQQQFQDVEQPVEPQISSNKIFTEPSAQQITQPSQDLIQQELTENKKQTEEETSTDTNLLQQTEDEQTTDITQQVDNVFNPQNQRLTEAQRQSQLLIDQLRGKVNQQKQNQLPQQYEPIYQRQPPEQNVYPSVGSSISSSNQYQPNPNEFYDQQQSRPQQTQIHYGENAYVPRPVYANIDEHLVQVGTTRTGDLGNFTPQQNNLQDPQAGSADSIQPLQYSPKPVYADINGQQVQTGTTRQLQTGRNLHPQTPDQVNYGTVQHEEQPIETVRDIEPIEVQVANEVQEVDGLKTIETLPVAPVEPTAAEEVTTQKPGFWTRLGTSIKNKATQFKEKIG